MKACLIYFALSLIASACTRETSRSPQVEKTEPTSAINKDNSTSGQTDFHTTYSDVIDNLFLYINKKDWEEVAEFYTEAADLEKALYFKNLFDSQKISELQLMKISKQSTGVYVVTKAKKTDSSLTSICFLFNIENNQIINQQLVSCRPN